MHGDKLMTTSTCSVIKLTDVYQQIQDQFQTTYEPELATLVNSTQSNRDLPVHNWFRFKEGYSPQLVDELLSRVETPNVNLKILDPFAGSGTTQVYAQFANTTTKRFSIADGIEVNPFIHFVSSTKTKWYTYSIDSLANELHNLNRLRDHLFNQIDESAVPVVSTISELRAFSKNTLDQLLNLKRIIELNVSIRNRDFFLLVYASILEPLSSMRKDGRALRIVRSKGHNPLLTRYAD